MHQTNHEINTAGPASYILFLVSVALNIRFADERAVTFRQDDNELHQYL